MSNPFFKNYGPILVSDILKLINNLNSKKLILQASLASMMMPQGGDAGKPKMKGFKIACVVENI